MHGSYNEITMSSRREDHIARSDARQRVDDVGQWSTYSPCLAMEQNGVGESVFTGLRRTYHTFSCDTFMHSDRLLLA